MKKNSQLIGSYATRSDAINAIKLILRDKSTYEKECLDYACIDLADMIPSFINGKLRNEHGMKKIPKVFYTGEEISKKIDDKTT